MKLWAENSAAPKTLPWGKGRGRSDPGTPPEHLKSEDA
jgi:hypothetical protein